MFALHTRRLARSVAAIVASIGMGVAAASAGAGSASGDHVAAVVTGAAGGVLTDPDGNEFSFRSFFVRAVLGGNGEATGRVRFVWRGSFPAVWGDPVCEGTCDAIILDGAVQSGSIAADGTVTLSGTAREVDTRQGKVVFDSGFDEPFSITVGGSLGPDNFITLQWCLLPGVRASRARSGSGSWGLTFEKG